MKKLLTLLVAAAMTLGMAFGFTSCTDVTGTDDTLIVYTEAGFAPFEYISGNEIVGVDVEIMNLVGKKLNKTVKFENVAFDTIIDAVSAGKLCNVGAAGISITDARKEKVDFSNEYYTANLYVIYPADQATDYQVKTTDGKTGIYWDKLAGKTIAVQSGTTADLFAGDEIGEGGTIGGTGAKISGFDELATALEDVGVNSDVLIIDELPAQKLIEGKSKYACAPLYYKGGEGEADEPACDVYAIAVTKGQTELLSAINEVLEELGAEGIQALVNKHLGI